MPVRAILFDKDGTLVDVVRTLAPAFHAILLELAEGDDGTAAALARAIRFDMRSRAILPGSPIAPGTPAELAAHLAPVLGVPCDPIFVQRFNAMLARETAKHLVAAPGALSVVGWLRTQNYRIGVSTNAAASHARDELERLGILRSLDFLAGFNSGFGAKPAPGHVLAFSAAIEVPTREIVCVGDSPYDLEAARRAGAIPIGVLGGSAALDALSPLAQHVIGTLEDLPVLLGTLDE